MPSETFDFSKLESMQFQKLCQKLLTQSNPAFEIVAAPDGGLDGIDRQARIGYQFYHPKKGARKTKIQSDLKKILKRWNTEIDALIWITSFDWTEKNYSWCSIENWKIKITVWGPERLSEKLILHSELIDEFHLGSSIKKDTTTTFYIGKQQAETIQNIKANTVNVKAKTRSNIKIVRERDPNALTEYQLKIITDEINNLAKVRKLPELQRNIFFKNELGKMKKIFCVNDWRNIPSYRFPEVMDHFRRQKFANRVSQTPKEERDGLLRSIFGKGKDIGWGEIEIHAWLKKHLAKNSLRMCSNNELRLILAEINKQRDL